MVTAVLAGTSAAALLPVCIAVPSGEIMLMLATAVAPERLSYKTVAEGMASTPPSAEEVVVVGCAHFSLLREM